MTFDFDHIVDRTGSGDIKHGALQTLFGRQDLQPLWVADMDFETPPFITNALRHRLDHSLFGYTMTPESFWDSIQRWILFHHGWNVRREWLTYIPGIVKGIGMVVNVFVGTDERVIIQPPVYHPFRLTPLGNKREVVMNPLLPQYASDGRLTGYEMDFDGLEVLAHDPKNRLLILSNPHNPAGITWSKDTLARVADICAANNVLVISDEIHCDMTIFGHRHIPFASVSETAAQISITFGAPSKTFNIAGIVSSYAIVPNDALRAQFFRWLEANELDSPTLFAPIATIAAFSEEGEEWRCQMLRYIEENICFVENFCRERMPEIHPLRPQASFLVWLDCRALQLSHKALIDLFVNQARLALNDGEMFGIGGEGFMRMNVASPRSIIAEALERLHAALHSTQHTLSSCKKNESSSSTTSAL